MFLHRVDPTSSIRDKLVQLGIFLVLYKARPVDGTSENGGLILEKVDLFGVDFFLGGGGNKYNTKHKQKNKTKTQGP